VPGVRATAIAERPFHAWLSRTTRRDRFNRMPVGDDVAALAMGNPGSGLLALTTDAFVQGTHFLPRHPPRAVGRALAEANLSDLASKGAVPVGFLLDLIVPRDQPIAWCEAVVRGVRDALRPYAVELSGGDTKWAPVPVLAGTAIGYLRPGNVPRRGAARPGDRLLATGAVGLGAAAALAERAAGPRARRAPTLSIRGRIAAGLALRPFARAMIDTSDGLGEAAHLLAAASGVAVEIRGEAIPWDPRLARRVRDPAERFARAAYGGDYELLASVPSERAERALRAVRATGTRATILGDVRRGHGAWVQWDSHRAPVPRSTWDPFGAGSARPGAPPRRTRSGAASGRPARKRGSA
jgi:thiamine-monophosphate kinase